MADGNGGGTDGREPEIEILEGAATELVPVDAEVSTQIATAKRFPRNVAKSMQRALSMATLDEETAAACFYNLPRSGKQIAGPSARLAEIVASSWGNVRFAARVMGHDEKDVRAQGMCWDLENNAAYSVEVRRRITDRNGRTYNDDMITVTGNAANSIAMRNAVLKIIPGVFWKKVYEAARKVAFGDAKTLVQRRQAVVEYFSKLGITPERIAAAVGKTSLEDIGLEELEQLTGLKTALKEGDTTIEESFPVPGQGEAGTAAKPRRRSEQQQAKPENNPPAAGSGSSPSPEPPKQEPPAAGGETTEHVPVGQGEVTRLDGGSVIKHPPKNAPKPDFKATSRILELMPKVDDKLGEKGAAKAMMMELYGTAEAPVDTVMKLTGEEAREWQAKLEQILAGA